MLGNGLRCVFPYSNGGFLFFRVVNLEDSCNSRCSCTRNKFDPICGVNNVMYYSPCYAGCKQEHFSDNVKVNDANIHMFVISITNHRFRRTRSALVFQNKKNRHLW